LLPIAGFRAAGMLDPMNEIRSFYEENGYYIARNVFSPEEMRVLEADFDRIVAQLLGSKEDVNARWSGPEMDRLDAGKTSIIHTHNVQQFSAAWHLALLQEKFLGVTEALLGPDIILHHTKLFMKPPEIGSPFPMHQDWTYFPTVNDTMLAGVIHVSKATDAMGCFRVYPGTQKLGKIRGTSGMEKSEFLARYPIEGSTPLEAEPGDVVFFHYFLLHGSLPNTSKKMRKTVLVQMHAGDDHVEAGNSHSNEKLVLKGWNHCAYRSSATAAKA
jgi:ectoine hydroxylase-related dioxygenase (phytanoyl-CoA dioxygenase family)